MTGKLYLVATPIGNLEDMTFRAVKTLQTVDLIAAEDTRHTGKLLKHYQISTPTISYHQHNHQTRVKDFIQRLTEGVNIALVTDAGTPAISDPGYDLVVACIQSKIIIVPIPGAIAAINGLIISGFPTDRFCFEGFLPQKKKLRDNLLQGLQGEKRTMIFYEAPHRLTKTLAYFAEYFGKEREISLTRELTKLHEDSWRGTLESAIAHYQNHKPIGEYTIIIKGNEQKELLTLSDEEIRAEIAKLMNEGMTKSSACQHLSQYLDISRREIYAIANLIS